MLLLSLLEEGGVLFRLVSKLRFFFFFVFFFPLSFDVIAVFASFCFQEKMDRGDDDDAFCFFCLAPSTVVDDEDENEANMREEE